MLHKKAKVNSQIYDVTNWETNNQNVHIAQYLKRYWNQTMKFSQLIEYNMRNIFLEQSCIKCDQET